MRTTALAAAISTTCAIACGGHTAATAPPPVDAPEAPPTAAGAAPETSAPACTFDLAAQRRLQPLVTASFENSDIGAILTQFTAGADGDALVANFDSRDVNGHETGTLEYECGAAGVALRQVTSTAGIASFRPALLVLPASEGSGDATGVLAIRAGDVDTVVGYTHRWSAAPSDPVPTFADLDASWVRVESTLQLDGAAAGRSWQTATTWAVAAAGHFFAARIEQSINDGTVQLDRIEVADSVRVAD